MRGRVILSIEACEVGRKSTVPDGWISLYRVIVDHRGTRDTELAAWVCDLGGIPVSRQGPDGVLSIRASDVAQWEWWHDTVVLRRPKRPRRRKTRSDAGPGRRRRRRKWRP
jgi:hypothetical protein